MTDQEIREALLRADDLLEAYKVVIKPVGEELARRMTAATGYAYKCELGGEEEGIDTMALRAEGERLLSLDELRKHLELVQGFAKKFFESLQNIWVSGV